MDEQGDSFGPIYKLSPRASDSRASPSPDERRLRILKVLVEAHIESGRPVPVSVLLERTEPAINPDRIEDDLAHLEAERLVEPASGSDARVPTQQSYRWYKDRFPPSRQGSGKSTAVPPSGAPATNKLAVASMVLSIIGITPWVLIIIGIAEDFAGVPMIGSLAGALFGHISSRQIKRSNGTQKGRGMAIAGLVLGYGVLVLLIAGIVALFIWPPTGPGFD